MFKKTDLVALGFGTVTLCSLLALGVLSPVSAGASTEYLPEQIVNQGEAIEHLPADSYGDSGLSATFPGEELLVSAEEDPTTMYY